MLWRGCPSHHHVPMCASQAVGRVWYDFDQLRPARRKPFQDWARARRTIEKATDALLDHTRRFLRENPAPASETAPTDSEHPGTTLVTTDADAADAEARPGDVEGAGSGTGPAGGAPTAAASAVDADADAAADARDEAASHASCAAADDVDADGDAPPPLEPVGGGRASVVVEVDDGAELAQETVQLYVRGLRTLGL